MDGIMKYLGVVVIGRNEGSRLGDCLDSFPDLWSRTIYVDSGSTDSSVQIARSRGITTIELVQDPFTAARGRQVGFGELCTAFPEIRYVQFVDGDCVLQPGWLERGVKYLEQNVRVAVVVGRLQERYSEQSLLIRLVNIDWDLPIGDIDAIGGISMVRISPLQKVGGWRTDLIAGEELDLGAR